MIGALLALTLCATPPPADSLAALYRSGRSWDEFLGGVNAQRGAWLANAGRARVEDALVTRARAIDGRWRLLVVAEDWCRDSVESLPYLARLVAMVPALELRVVSAGAGREVMRRHRTPDGRAATPTMVVLDSAFAERGCFIERPEGLRRWIADHRGRLDEAALQAGKRDWYRRDAGRSVVREVVAALERAAAGGSGCAGSD